MTTTSGPMPAADPTRFQERLDTIAPGVYVLGAMGNSFAVDTAEGLLLVDTGRTPEVAQGNLRLLAEVTSSPLRWIVYSHGHQGYNAGVSGALAQAWEQGWARPEIIAHERVVDRYRRYQRTAELQRRLNARQFRLSMSAFPEEPPLRMPDRTYSERLTLGTTDREIVLLSTPSETDCSTAVWLPQERILFGSSAVLDHIPNIGTPLRTYRDTMRWADTLDRLADLRPAIVIPEFGEPRTEDPEHALRAQARALRWLHHEVTDRLNRGLVVEQILHDIDYPAELFDVSFMSESYGHRDYIVRDIVRSETGWWDGNPTSLHPSRPDDARQAIADAISDKEGVLAHAEQLRDAGKPQEALHVVDLLALAPGDDPAVVRARALKQELCAIRAEQTPSFVSQSLYLTPAPEPRLG